MNGCIDYKCLNDTIDVSKGIDVNKTTNSCNCNICCNRYFLKIKFTFQQKVCNGYHDLMQKAMSFNDVPFVSVKGNDYRVHFGYLTKCWFDWKEMKHKI